MQLEQLGTLNILTMISSISACPASKSALIYLSALDVSRLAELNLQGKEGGTLEHYKNSFMILMGSIPSAGRGKFFRQDWEGLKRGDADPVGELRQLPLVPTGDTAEVLGNHRDFLNTGGSAKRTVLF